MESYALPRVPAAIKSHKIIQMRAKATLKRADNAKCLLDSEKRQAELEFKFWTGPDWEDHDGFRNAACS